MGVAMLIDRLATLYDWRWRSVLTAVAVAASGATIVGWLTLAWRRGLRWERVARDVDRQLPQLEERWTTVTRLGENAANPQFVHPAMLRKVAAEASSLEPHVDPQQVVSLSALGRAMVGLSAIAAALVVAVVLDSHRTVVLLKRFWMPGASVSATELVGTPGNLVVGRGEALDLNTNIQGTPVERAVLYMQSRATPEESITLVAQGEEPIVFSHHIRAVDDPFQYRFRAGDGQTDWFQVEVADWPEIESVQMTITPPAYAGQPEASFDKLPRRLSAIEESQLELAIRPTVPVKDLQLRLGDDRLVAMTAGEDGWYHWQTTLSDNMLLSPVLTEEHGLTNSRVAKMQINVTPDRPPIVKVLSPDDQVAVRPDDTIEIKFTAQDDVGIAGAELVLYDQSDAERGPLPLTTIPIPLDGQIGARQIEGSVNLDLSQFELNDGRRSVTKFASAKGATPP